MLAHCFAKKPTKVVTLDRACEQLFSDDESDPTNRAFRGRREQLKMCPVETPPGLEQTRECWCAPESVALVRAYRNVRGQRGASRAGLHP